MTMRPWGLKLYSVCGNNRWGRIIALSKLDPVRTRAGMHLERQSRKAGIYIREFGLGMETEDFLSFPLSIGRSIVMGLLDPLFRIPFFPRSFPPEITAVVPWLSFPIWRWWNYSLLHLFTLCFTPLFCQHQKTFALPSSNFSFPLVLKMHLLLYNLWLGPTNSPACNAVGLARCLHFEFLPPHFSCNDKQRPVTS